MITQITHLTLFVKNQDEAKKFYTENLGFKVHTDEKFGEMRWLTLHAANQPNFEIALMEPETKEEQALVGKQGSKKPLFCVATSDCRKDIAAFAKKGVKVLGEPKDEPWGISASLEDLYGNHIYMCQMSQPAK